MISAFAKAVEQLSDPRIRRVVWRSIIAALIVFVLLLTVAWWAVAKTVLFQMPWLETVSDVLGGTLAVIIAIVLFPAAVSGLVGLFLEEIANAVEARHYAALPAARGPGLAEGIWTSAKLIALMVALNLLALPLYLIPVINLLVFYALNGYLLGREYFELVALRRMGPAEARALRKRHNLGVTLAGAVVAFVSTIPVINLLAPVVGTAAMVHRFHGWWNHSAAG